jgi:hypothetical protein
MTSPNVAGEGLRCGNLSDPVSQTNPRRRHDGAHDRRHPARRRRSSCPAARASPTSRRRRRRTRAISSPSESWVTTSAAGQCCAGSYDRTRDVAAKDACGNLSDPVSQYDPLRRYTAPSIGDPGPTQTIQWPASRVIAPPTVVRTLAILESPQNHRGHRRHAAGQLRRVLRPAPRTGGRRNAAAICRIRLARRSRSSHDAPVIGQPGAGRRTIQCPRARRSPAADGDGRVHPSPQIHREVIDVTTLWRMRRVLRPHEDVRAKMRAVTCRLRGQTIHVVGIRRRPRWPATPTPGPDETIPVSGDPGIQQPPRGQRPTACIRVLRSSR